MEGDELVQNDALAWKVIGIEGIERLDADSQE